MNLAPRSLPFDVLTQRDSRRLSNAPSKGFRDLLAVAMREVLFENTPAVPRIDPYEDLSDSGARQPAHAQYADPRFHLIVSSLFF